MSYQSDSTPWDADDPDAELWTVERIADLFDVRPYAVRHWLTHEGRVPFRKMGGSLRVEKRYVRELAIWRQSTPHIKENFKR